MGLNQAVYFGLHLHALAGIGLSEERHLTYHRWKGMSVTTWRIGSPYAKYSGKASRETDFRLREMLTTSLGDLLRPVRVKAVRITRVEPDVVSGFLLANCPVENLDYWRDFEVHLTSSGDGSVKYAMVDGRRFVSQTSPSSRHLRHPSIPR